MSKLLNRPHHREVVPRVGRGEQLEVVENVPVVLGDLRAVQRRSVNESAVRVLAHDDWLAVRPATGSSPALARTKPHDGVFILLEFLLGVSTFANSLWNSCLSHSLSFGVRHVSLE